MSILANINPLDNAKSKFMKVFDKNNQCATEFENAFSTDDKGGRDHFISIFNDITHVTNLYTPGADILNPPPANIDFIIDKIQNNENLRKWVISVFCAFIYAFDNNNAINVIPIPFKTITGTVTEKVPDSEFLEIWQQKFNNHANNDNCYGNFTPDINNNSLNILAFSEKVTYSDMIGCYSKEYFVIPLKEMALQGEKIKPWKKTYNKLMACGENFINRINDMLNLRQKVLLRCTAKSIANDAASTKSLKLIAAIIGAKINIDGVVLNGVDISPMKSIGNVELFRIKDMIDIDNLISGKLNILCATDGEFYSTYPFTETMLTALTSRVGKLTDLSLVVNSHQNVTGKEIENAVINARYTSEFVFDAPIAGNEKRVIYSMPIEKVYKPENINNIIAMPTLCMYPNLSVDYEEQCHKYTYLSCDGALIMGEPLVNVTNTSLQNGSFKAAMSNGAGRSTIFSGDGFASKTVTLDNTFTIRTQSASISEHFIELSDDLGAASFGYIMNIRNSNADKDVSALLHSSKNEKVNISFDQNAPVANGDFNAYIDFGSSSSYMAYAIGGALLTDIIKDDCTMRMLLIDYNEESKKKYKNFINDPRETNIKHFPSASIIYDPFSGVNDMYIYKDAWMPITKTFSEFAMSGVSIQPSMKTSLIKDLTEKSPNIIINNLCYIIACNAVVNNRRTVNILPSLPSEDYLGNMKTLWDNAILNMKAIFPNITINNLLILKQKEFLYESVAISNGTAGVGVNVLQINIDIGDGTTDMSAMIIDGLGNKDMCGYSSIEYAGKNLIKTALKDILNSTDKSTAIHLFKGMHAQKENPSDALAMNFGSPLLEPAVGQIDNYCGRVNNLIDNFFEPGPTGSRKSSPEVSWENNIIDILEISNMRGGIDMKVASNLILRYMLLMPVIKDFVLTAIKIAGTKMTKGVTTINIDFYGGAAKGIKLLSAIDNRTPNAEDMLKSYFYKEFDGYAVNVSVPPIDLGIDSKESLIKGLANIPFTPDGAGGFHLGAGAANIAQINWGKVNPKNSAIFGEEDSVHKGTEKFNFVSLADCSNAPDVAQRENNSKIHSQLSYYNNPNNPFDELSEYFYNEIFGKLIDNSDGIADNIEIIIGNFINGASENMKNTAKKELLPGTPNNSFYRATHSSIYPEMIKNSIFMFTISELLSKYHGTYKTSGKIKNFDDAGTYKFRG